MKSLGGIAEPIRSSGLVQGHPWGLPANFWPTLREPEPVMDPKNTAVTPQETLTTPATEALATGLPRWAALSPGELAGTTTTIGFLSILGEGASVLGGYLITNGWGRPLEFRLSSAVQPNRVQQILYGPTLEEYLHAELIGKTLVEKSTTQPHLILTDSIWALAIRPRVGIPTLARHDAWNESATVPLLAVPTDRARQPLWLAKAHEADLPWVLDRLERVDPSVELTEPFSRVREAILEARKLGVSSRAA